MTDFEQDVYKAAQAIEEKIKGSSIFGVAIDEIADYEIRQMAKLVAAYEFGLRENAE